MKTPDHIIAIVLAARDHVVALADEPARGACRLVDQWARGEAGADALAQAEAAARDLAARQANACATNGVALAAEGLLRATRFAEQGDHTRIVAAAAMDAVHYTTTALVRGAATR